MLRNKKKTSVGKGSLWTYDRMFRLLHGTGKVVGRIRQCCLVTGPPRLLLNIQPY